MAIKNNNKTNTFFFFSSCFACDRSYHRFLNSCTTLNEHDFWIKVRYQEPRLCKTLITTASSISAPKCPTLPSVPDSFSFFLSSRPGPSPTCLPPPPPPAPSPLPSPYSISRCAPHHTSEAPEPTDRRSITTRIQKGWGVGAGGRGREEE